MRSLITRTITGIAFLIFIVLAILWHPLAFGLLVFIFLVIGLTEYYRLIPPDSASPGRIPGILVSAAIYLLAMLTANRILPLSWLALVLPLIMLILVAELFGRKGQSLANAAVNVFQVIYIAVPLSLLNFMMNLPVGAAEAGSPWIILGFFILVWINDIFAYIIGSLAGRHKLFPEISPGKSWEGLTGGLVFAMLGGYLLSYFFREIYSPQWIAIGAVIAIFGVLGDLFESKLKRQAMVKDTGTLLPGHGGVLDRFDALLFSAPAVYLYLVIFLS